MRTKQANFKEQHLLYTIGLSLTLILAALLLSVFSDKHLSADGANYFTIILESHTFTYIDWTRQFANYLSQFPLVFAVNLGVRDIPFLSIISGMSVLFPWVFSIGISFYLLRNEDKSVLLFMIISMVSVNLSSDYILCCEQHASTLLSWPILFGLLKKTELSWLDGVFLLVLTFLYTRLYPTSIIPAILFFCIGIYRAIHLDSLTQRIILFGANFLLSLSIAISTYAILYPRDVGNKARFSSAIIPSLMSPEGIVSVAFLLILIIGWWWNRKTLLRLSLLPVAVFAIYILFREHAIASYLSFSSRTFTLTLLPLLLLAAAGTVRMGYRADSTVTNIIAQFVLMMTISNIQSTLEWRKFKADFLKVLDENTGMVPVEKTLLASSHCRWSWNNKQLSDIWSNGCVQSIVRNDENVGWEPDGPPKYFPLKNYTCYTQEFSRYDPELCICEKQTINSLSKN